MNAILIETFRESDRTVIYIAEGVAVHNESISASRFRPVPDPDDYTGNEINAFLSQGRWIEESGLWFTDSTRVVPL